MHSFFESSGNANILQRLEKLESSAQRRWGSMTVEAMLWHLRMQVEMALGMHEVKLIHSILRYPPFRWLALYVIPWPKGAATAPAMNAQKQQPALPDFTTGKRLLMERLQQAAEATHLHPHPLFGNLSKKAWGYLLWKHIDHHFRQFGA